MNDSSLHFCKSGNIKNQLEGKNWLCSIKGHQLAKYHQKDSVNLYEAKNKIKRKPKKSRQHHEMEHEPNRKWITPKEVLIYASEIL